MKRKLYALIVGLVTFIGVINACADTAIFDGLTLIYGMSAGEVTIIGGTSSSDVLSIPSIIDGCPVVGIDDYAFRDSRYIKTLTLPSSMRKIGRGAFSGCSGLKSVEISNGVTNIGSSAFADCSALESISIPAGVIYIGGSVFYGCSQLKSVSIPEGVERIEERTFYCCQALVSVKMPSSIRSIGDYAFYCCYGLKSVVLPPGLMSIGDSAFRSCSNITSITFPEGEVNVKGRVFKDCLGLADGRGLIIINGVVYGYIGSAFEVLIPEGTVGIGDYAFDGCGKLTAVGLPSSIRKIGLGAFRNCGKLASMVIPEGVTCIEDETFSGCASLGKVTIPKSVNDIRGMTPFYRTGLPFDQTNGMVIVDKCLLRCKGSGCVDIRIPSGVRMIAGGAFHLDGGDYASVSIPTSVVRICDHAFYGCRLKTVQIPPSVMSVGEMAFYGSGVSRVDILDLVKWCEISFDSSNANPLSEAGCLWLNGEKIKDLIIPKGVICIKGFSFLGCAGLASVTIPEGATAIGEYAFYNCSGLTSVSIPGSVTNIGECAFSNCRKLPSIMIPMNVTSIAERAFEGCSGLTSVTIPEGMISIGDRAFYGCSGLTSVTIPEGVISIGDRAFYGCSGLESVAVPPSVMRIGMLAFSQCDNLKEVHLLDLAKWCEIVFEDTFANPLCYAKHLYYGEEEVKNLVIPDGVEYIRNYAFCNCSGLTSVTMSESVMHLGKCSFSECDGVESLLLSSNVAVLPEKTFSGCRSLKTLVIPSGVTRVESEAFSGCTELKDVSIPLSVRRIEEAAFANCSNITNMILPFVGSGCSLNSETGALFGRIFGREFYSGGLETCQCYLSEALQDQVNYETYYIPQTLKSVTILDGTVIIGYGAFCNCRGLTSVTIPLCVTNIGDKAFYNCGELLSVTIPDGVTSIGEEVFYGCSGLNSIEIPSGVTRIGYGAFYGCRELKSLRMPESLKDIGSCAFCLCQSLSSVTIPEGVTSIGGSTFEGCSGLTSVTIPEGMISIGNRAFYGCSGLTSVTIPEGVISIGDRAFYGCSGLESVAVPPSVMRIGMLAFSQCDNLKEVHLLDLAKWCEIVFEDTFANPLCYAKHLYYGEEEVKNLVIPDGVEYIRNYAFYNCDSVMSLSIPFSVTNVGVLAFYACTGLRTLAIPACTELPHVLESAYPFVVDIKIQPGVTRVPPRFFADCVNLSSVEIPDSVTNVATDAFLGCLNLRSAKVSGTEKLSVLLPGVYSSLSNITICPGVTKIVESAFRDCRGLESISVPEGVLCIGDKAFFGCCGLKQVNLPVSATNVSISAFANCSNIVSASVAVRNVRAYQISGIGDGRFAAFGDYYENLTAKIYVYDESFDYSYVVSDLYGFIWEAPDDYPYGLRTEWVRDPLGSIIYPSGHYAGHYEEDYPSDARVRDILLGRGLNILTWTYEGRSGASAIAIQSCKVSTMELPTSGICALFPDSCEKIAHVDICAATSIGDGFFNGCSNLASVMIPSSVTNVGDNAFAGCKGLELVVVYGDEDGESTVRCLSERRVGVNLEKCSILKLEPEFTPEDGTVFDSALAVMVSCPVEGAILHYTDDGSNPTVNSKTFSKQTIIQKTTFKAIAEWRGILGGVKTACYAKGRVTTPVISSSSTEFRFPGYTVCIDCETPGAQIHYTTNGSTPSERSPLYVGPFVIDDTTTVKAIATGHVDYIDSGIASQTFVREWVSASSPVISSTEVLFVSPGNEISITCETEGAVIHFTTNGTNPTSESPVYSSPFIIDDTMTVKAIAVGYPNYRDSEVVSRTFIREWLKSETPSIVAYYGDVGTGFETTIPRGSFLWATINCETDGAEIHYTVDGSVPTKDSPVYVGPFKIAETTTIRAIAIKDDYKGSDVASVKVIKVWTDGDSLNAPDLVFTGGGAAKWTRDTAISHDGAESMRSGAISDGEVSRLQAVVSGEGTLTFYWRASCEQTDMRPYWWDYGAFEVDGDEVEWIDGVTDWVKCTVSVEGDGEHVLTWKYVKDSSGSVEGDCIWLDEVNWVPADDEEPTVVFRKVTFDANGGCAAFLEKDVEDGTVVGELPTATREGYSFLGWFTALSGGTQVSADTVITAAVTFFAQWTANAYSVKFDANGGTGTMADEPMTYDAAKALTTNAFTKKGYTFAGWATSAGGAVKYANGATVKNLTATAGGTVTLYAKWTQNNYVIDFNPGQGGTGTMSDQSMTYDEEEALYQNLFARTGYTFLGWTDDEGELEEVLFYDGVVVSNLTDEVDGECDLYAVWAANEYTVRFDANGGEGTMSDQAFLYDEEQDLYLNCFTRVGHSFEGWARSAKGAVAFGDGGSASNLTAEADGLVTLYAQWSANPYTVKFDANGGEGEMSDMDCTYGVSKQLTFNSFTRVGYAFAGWATSAKGEVAYANGAAIKSIAASGVVTLYAKWTAVSYSVKFNANGGSGSMADQAMTYDAAKALTACAFTRTGYTFAGWAVGAPGGRALPDGESVKNLTDVDGGVVTLYAVWAANEYTVKFNANGGKGAMVVQAFLYDAAQNLTSNGFTRAGCEFLGWATSAVGEVVYADGEAVSNLTAEADGVVNLYAVWDGTATAWMEDDEFSAAVANTYDGYVIDEDCNLLGVVQVKTTKQTVKKTTDRVTKTVTVTTNITATATVTDANGKKWSYSKGVVTVEGVVTGLKCTTKGCPVAEFGVTLGKNGLNGAWGEYAIFGARNGMGTKGDPMMTALEAYKGKWSVTIAAARPAAAPYQAGESSALRLQLNVQAKGVVKIAGNWENGAKVSASAQLVMGDGFAYVPVMVKSTKTSPAVNALLRIDAGGEVVLVSATDPARPAVAPYQLAAGGWTVEALGELDYLPSEVSKGGAAFSARVAIDELAYPAKFAAKKLPTGLKIDAATGVISGTPTKPGHYVAEVTVTSGLNSKVKKTLTVEFDIANYTDDLIPIEDSYGPYYVGVAAEEQIDAAAGCTVSGLPSGLKWTAKDILDTKTKQVKTAANTIYGIPTKACTNTVYFKKTVKEMVNGKQKSVTHQASATFRVEGMRPWAVGTFNGPSCAMATEGRGGENGLVQLTIAKTGKISGKWMSEGLTWTLSAASFDAFDAERAAYHATLTAKSGKVSFEVEIEVTEEGVASELFEAWRNEWKEEPWKTRATALKGKKVPIGEALLTIGSSGAVTAKGTFVTGYDTKKQKDITYSATCSTVLIPQDEEGTSYAVYLYFPPKPGKFEGWASKVIISL